MRDEIIIYQADEGTTRLEVKIDEGSVWLNRQQISTLFERDIKTIGKHIANVLTEELKEIPVVAKFATTATDGKTYRVEYYNLDVIISVGYRVKSSRGIQFRIWANNVLKDYLLKGYALSHRFDRIEKDVNYLKTKVEEFDFQIKTNLPPKEGIFFEGQVFDAYIFVIDLIRKAQESIILIDNYIDESVLLMLSKRQSRVEVIVYTSNLTAEMNLDLRKYRFQYPDISITQFNKSHDRFLILDKKIIYHIGASLKDLGKRWFAFSVLDFEVTEILKKLEDNVTK
ncbi:MAG: DNA-binding protein [Bacteroidetes bacterium GWE2_40_15]|nr:MAG: DNA-binding protein [Bacteroidetes bacterium GWE2_40_15]